MTIARFPRFALLAVTIGKASDLSITALIDSARAAVLIVPILLSVPQIAHAADARTVGRTLGGPISESIEYDEMADAPLAVPTPAIAHFGPFAVIDERTAELIGETDSDTPAQFTAMIRAYPKLSLIRMVECPGTIDDEANLLVARMIRTRRIATYVPASGSIRSGGVELFLAGVRRSADHGAEIGVHSWQDDEGREARDVPANDPVHDDYINFYRSVGLSDEKARAFYAFTNNAAPASGIYYMTPAELRHFSILN